jgi:hypothetical protein
MMLKVSQFLVFQMQSTQGTQEPNSIIYEDSAYSCLGRQLFDSEHHAVHFLLEALALSGSVHKNAPHRLPLCVRFLCARTSSHRYARAYQSSQRQVSGQMANRSKQATELAGGVGGLHVPKQEFGNEGW